MTPLQPTFERPPEEAVGSGRALSRAMGRRGTRILGVVGGSRTIKAGLAIIVALFLLAALAPLLTPHSPIEIDLANTLRAPSTAHPLGTDELGRDQLARILYGARISMFTGAIAVFIAAFFGGAIGLVAGYLSGVFDSVAMRLMDAILAFPGLLLALLIVSVLGPGLLQVLIAFGIGGIPFYARLMRGMVLSVREQEFIEAARALGVSRPRIIVRHILPNSVAPLIITTTLAMGLVMVGLAGLGFLGLGAQPPDPEWGAMLAGSQSRFFTAPWLLISPGVMILFAVTGYTILGDGLRDALDPRLRQFG